MQSASSFLRPLAFVLAATLPLAACQAPDPTTIHAPALDPAVPSAPGAPNAAPSPDPAVPADPEPTRADCTLVPESIGLKQGRLSFPRQGLFVTEAHYATREETFADHKTYPTAGDEGIAAHLQASCDRLRERYGFAVSDDCYEVFRHSYERVWTPAEGGGAIGQGATGTKPTREQEMWQGNMMYASGQRPAPGTKYILTNPDTGRSVVVSFGYEVGPGDAKWLGGLTTEVQWALGNADFSANPLRIGRAKDQALPYGPVDCAE